MNVLIVDDDPPERARHIARWPGAHVQVAASAATARRVAASIPPDVLVAELAIPETDGAAIRPHQERITLDHRLVGAEFPGTRLVRGLFGATPRVVVHTWLAGDHPDVRDLRALGVEEITHKGTPFDIPVQRDPTRVKR